MLQRIGLAGVAGTVLLVAGLAVIAVLADAPVVAGGLLLILLGVGLLAKGLVDAVLASMGLGGMF